LSRKPRKQPREARVSWLSLNFGILFLIALIALVGWAVWYLPRNISTAVNYETSGAGPTQTQSP
jgi:hypothetical protein